MQHNKPKIWIVVFTGNTGLTHYSYCLASALQEAGHEVSLVTNENYDLGGLGAAFPVIRLFGRTRRYLLDLLRFWRLFRLERPAIVHYQGPLKYPLAELPLLALQRYSGAGLVYTAHDWLPHHRRFYHSVLYRRYYRQFDCVIVHSGAGRAFLANRMGLQPDRLAVIPHGSYGFFNTDPDMTAERARQRLGLDGRRFWFLFFGHIAPHKGLTDALEALAAIPDSGGAVPVGLLVAGDPGGWSMEPYSQLIDRLQLAERVDLRIGHIPFDDVQLYVKAADAMLLPYRESSTSGVAHVALGFAKPVVATDVGGMADTIEDGKTGLLTPPGDVEALAAAMRVLARDEECRRSLARGWEKTHERFSWDRIAGLTKDVYASIW